MFKKVVKKLALAATLTALATTVVAASACNVETKHPEVRITVEFNESTYELDYTLYRNMYPNTVKHFIELADNGLYNNTFIHDYRTTDWITGGYEYNASEYNAAAQSSADGALTDYLVNHSLASSYLELFAADKLTATVYSDSEFDNGKQIVVKTSALPTLIGEFKNNINQVIEKGELYAEQGTLKMFYYTMETTDKVHVTPTDDQVIWNADFKTNSATSLFSMQVGGSSSLNSSNYCVFGKMDSTTKLLELIDAVNDYYDDNDAESKIARDVSVEQELATAIIDNDIDWDELEMTFTLPALPIIIRSVKVIKY